jgi:hypothetical protein
MPADIDHDPIEPFTAEPLALSWPVDRRSAYRLSRVLAAIHIESQDVLRWALMSDDEVEAETTRIAGLFTGQASVILARLAHEAP